MIHLLKILQRTQHRRIPSKGTSFIEVMAGLMLVSILFVPMFGILSASGRIWNQFEGGHGASANRQMALQELDRRLRLSNRIESYSPDGIVYLDSTNIKNQISRKQRVKQNGQTVFDLVREGAAGPIEILAEDIGLLSVSLVAQNPVAGELLEIRIANPVNPRYPTARSHSSRYVWKRI